MKKNSFFSVLLFAAAILFTGASLTSCGSDDDKSNPESSGSSENSTSTKDGIIGWYCQKVYTSADFASYNATAEEYKHKTNSREFYILFLESEYDGESDYFAPHYEYNPDYVDPNPDPNSYYFINTVPNPSAWKNEFIHIIDESTLAHYRCMGIKKIGTSSRDLLYQLNGGTNIGMLAYYGSNPTYYVYTREGDKITITQGKEKEVFVIVDDGLLQNGGGKWKKYNPKQVH